VRAAIDKADAAEAAKVLIEMLASADVASDDQERLRQYVVERSGIGRRELNRMLKTAQQERAAKSRQQERERRAA
jgi:hypothetical protein